MHVSDPFNVYIMDVDRFITENNAMRVTSHAIHEASSTDFDPDGLFSEVIFGQTGSNERIVKFGYIELNTAVLHPIIYRNIIKLSAAYEEIMNGTSFAIFDEEKRDFIRRPEGTERADTGFSFFLSRFRDIDFTQTGSRTRSDKIDVIEKYKELAIIRRMLVLPAGLRDIEIDAGMLSQDDINKLYTSLLSYSLAIPPGATSTIYDTIRVNMQRKIVEIYNYIENINTDKKGFIQGAWGQRRVALGTRNVITAANFQTETPDDPQAIRVDETKIGIFQTMKMLQPAVVHIIRTAILEPIFGTNTTIVPLINTETYSIEYRELSAKELARFDTDAAIDSMISRFNNVNLRDNPITIRDIEDKLYYLCMIYDTGDEISLFRSITDFEGSYGREVDRKFVRPMTWADMCYLAAHNASEGRHVFITRYPITGEGSTYPSKIHLVSTMPSRVVGLRDAITGTLTKTYPEYPIIGRAFIDSVIIHTSRIAGLGGDYDGDMVSINSVLTEESNNELREYFNSARSVVDSQQRLIFGGDASDLVKWTFMNVSRM